MGWLRCQHTDVYCQQRCCKPGLLCLASLLLPRPGLLWGSCVPFLCCWCGWWEWAECHCLPRPRQESQTLCQFSQVWSLQPVRSQSVCEQSWALASVVGRHCPSSSHVTWTSSWIWVWTCTWPWRPFSGAHTLVPPAPWGTWESFGLPCDPVCGKLLTTWCDSQSQTGNPRAMWSMTWTSIFCKLRKVLKKFYTVLNL